MYLSRKCMKCSTDINKWIEKYSKMSKVYLDQLYFEENKIPCRVDERGSYIPGEKFAEIELEKSKEKCPRCGSKELVEEEDVQWGPI